MKDLGPYLYLVLFAAFALLNYLMQKLSRRQQGQQPVEEEEDSSAPDGGALGEELARRRAAERDALLRAERQSQRSAETVSRGREQPQQRSRLPQKVTEPVGRVRSSVERVSRVRAVAEPEEVRNARARAPRAATVAPSRAQSPRLRELRALLADRGHLRQAIILTTVLGPCRAQQPSE